MFSTLLAPVMTLQLEPNQRFVMTAADKELRENWSVFNGEVWLQPRRNLVWRFSLSADEGTLSSSSRGKNPVSLRKVHAATDAAH
ncbi:MAG: hypothetical protein JKY65_24905 [Planctomycetes bacterium]|nr:hypothetical protein [Planctomycetota bacterium]